MEKSNNLKTATVYSTKGKNQMEKSDIKGAITIDSTKNSKYGLALQILLLVLAIVFGVALAFRVFYVHEDTTTVLYDPNFQIEAVSSSSLSVLTRYIHPLVLHNPDNWNLTFLIRNLNSDYDFYYHDFKASISYNNTLLWSANVSGKFYQDAKSQTTIDSTFAALPESYTYWIGTSIVGDFASGQTTRFSISLSGNIQISDHKSPSHTSCRELHLPGMSPPLQPVQTLPLQ
ncbi:hypothetical protein HAX54_026798 [Datura stramonium]|uniref:Late embryogenesis abundant protein LEA-2 subgroup domain-containing protein n=1 Tax=Datura stramonium TaxID=4076 RepID=A0ABS8V1J6_DATST|nr:hypothetical protein [Datura stramonium]